jgi:predicted aminopeptidase
MSNAHFALVSTYHDLVPAFRAMLAKEKHLPDFYQAVSKLAKMEKTARRQALLSYLPPDGLQDHPDTSTTAALSVAPQ